MTTSTSLRVSANGANAQQDIQNAIDSVAACGGTMDLAAGTYRLINAIHLRGGVAFEY